MKKLMTVLAAMVLLLAADKAAAADAPDYDIVTAGTRLFGNQETGFGLRMLLEASNLGGDELEMAEMVFPAGYRGSGHLHTSMEIFYVLSGTLTHIVNGQGAVLSEGMVGVVRSGDSVIHITDTEHPTKLLVIWLPGGEAGRIFSQRTMEPIAPLNLISQETLEN